MLFDYSGLKTSIQKITLSFAGIAGSQYNAILTIVVSVNSNVVIDPNTGNYVLDGIDPQEFKARLKKKSSNKFEQVLNIGTPFTRLELEGYFLDLETKSLALPQKIPCQLLDNGIWVRGSFYPALNTHSDINENFQIRNALGVPLRGVFEVQGNVNS